MKWKIEEIDDGRKYIIRRPDRRVIAVFTFLAESDVYEDDLPRLFASADAMLTLCRKVIDAWKQGDRHASFALAHEAESIVAKIDDNGYARINDAPLCHACNLPLSEVFVGQRGFKFCSHKCADKKFHANGTPRE